MTDRTDPFAQDTVGRTALFYAAEREDLKEVLRMIFGLAGTGLWPQRLALIGVRDSSRLTASDVAEQAGDREIADLLRGEQMWMEDFAERTVSKATSITIVNVGYRSTNYWVVSAGTSRLLVDIGWRGTLGAMKANLRRMDVPLREIRYALATHYHIDHAGLAEELKREGIPLLVLDVQVHAIPTMKTWTKPRDNYVDITETGNVKILFDESRQLLSEIGIPGEILHTPGHSDHCVSLFLDDGSVFTGDLPSEAYVFDNPVALATWKRLRERGAARVYPAHGPTRALDDVQHSRKL